MRVLIVEDDQSDSWFFSEILRSRGYQVVARASGEDTLRSLEEGIPDLVLLDLVLPGIDGLEVCRRIDALDPTGRTPFVLVVTSKEVDALPDVLAAGADDFIRKPVDAATLGIRLDIAERRIREGRDLNVVRHELRSKTSELETLFNNVQDVFFSVDVTDERIIQISPATKYVFGYAQEELVADKSRWQKVLLPGTDDHNPWQDLRDGGPLDTPRATREEVLELLEMVQDCFPGAALGIEHVLAAWAGIRPLIQEEGKTTRDTSREDEVWSGPDGLVTIAGGKLTTYRRMAERALDEVQEVLGPPPRDEIRTTGVPLPGAPEGDFGDFESQATERLRTAGVPDRTVERLQWLYGRQLHHLLELAETDAKWLEPLGPGVPAVRGEVKLAVEREMASTLIDFMDRRSALLLFSPDFGLAGAGEAAQIMGALLRWDEAHKSAEVERYRAYADEHRVPSE